MGTALEEHQRGEIARLVEENQRLRRWEEAYGEDVRALRQQLAKASPSSEPHWLYKDFNVLYRVAKRFSEACMGRADDGKPYAAHEALKAQLERLAPAFTDTEEIRAAMRGE